MGTLDGKVALITGAGQGVGQGIALALAAEGAQIAVSGRTASKLDATVKLIEERAGRAIPITCNVKDEASLTRMVDEVVDEFGGELAATAVADHDSFVVAQRKRAAPTIEVGSLPDRRVVPRHVLSSP